MLNKEELLELKNWLSAPEIDDPEDLFEKVPTIIELIDFWLEKNEDKQ